MLCTSCRGAPCCHVTVHLPLQVLFDCGLGDIFVIRVAGHVVDSASVASVEYAVEHLGALAVIVVGHEKCGAISAAVGEFRARAAGAHSAAAAAAEAHKADEGDPSASHIGSLLGMLQPCVQASVDAFAAAGVRLEDIDGDELVEAALRMNVSQTAKSLTDRSPMLAKRVRDGRLAVAGFRYDIDSPADEDGDGGWWRPRGVRLSSEFLCTPRSLQRSTSYPSRPSSPL